MHHDPTSFLAADPRFTLTPWVDLHALQAVDIPDIPGVYVLAAETARFRYPRDDSAVFYIGQSKSLRGRIAEHWKHVEACRTGSGPRKLYWPRYEYAAACTPRICWAPVSPKEPEPKPLESLALALFAKRYRSFPVANGAGAWSRIDEVF